MEQGGILKFEVFHKPASLTSAGMTLQEGNHLVGVAFVPLSNLIEGNGKTRMTGLYDIVSKINLYKTRETNKEIMIFDKKLHFKREQFLFLLNGHPSVVDSIIKFTAGVRIKRLGHYNNNKYFKITNSKHTPKSVLVEEIQVDRTVES